MFPHHFLGLKNENPSVSGETVDAFVFLRSSFAEVAASYSGALRFLLRVETSRTFNDSLMVGRSFRIFPLLVFVGCVLFNSTTSNSKPLRFRSYMKAIAEPKQTNCRDIEGNAILWDKKGIVRMMSPFMAGSTEPLTLQANLWN